MHRSILEIKYDQLWPGADWAGDLQSSLGTSNLSLVPPAVKTGLGGYATGWNVPMYTCATEVIWMYLVLENLQADCGGGEGRNQRT